MVIITARTLAMAFVEHRELIYDVYKITANEYFVSNNLIARWSLKNNLQVSTGELEYKQAKELLNAVFEYYGCDVSISGTKTHPVFVLESGETVPFKPNVFYTVFREGLVSEAKEVI